MKAKALVVMFCTLSAAVARAHVNNVPAVARYTSPLGPVAGSTDGGVTIQPYSPAVADQTFRITWEDGDQDPTGNFTFYYLSYQPHYQLDGNYLAANSEPLIAVGETQAAIRWVSCICEPDLGIACPDAGARPCANEVVWDTSLIEPGAYWIVAINNDPPFITTSVPNGPVIVHHGSGSRPPAAVILRPDGMGSFDREYKVMFWASGVAPLRFNIAYGRSDPMAIDSPTTLLGNDLTLTADSQGLFTFTWDLTSVPGSRGYFVRLFAKDGEGRMVRTDSRYQLTVYHPNVRPDAGTQPSTPPDLAAGPSTSPPMPTAGCDVGGPATPVAFAGLAAFVALMLLVAARRV